MLFATSRPTVRLYGPLTALIGLTSQSGMAKSVTHSRWQEQVGVGGWAASGQVTPFWFQANPWSPVLLTVSLATDQGQLPSATASGFAGLRRR